MKAMEKKQRRFLESKDACIQKAIEVLTKLEAVEERIYSRRRMDTDRKVFKYESSS